MAKSGKGGGGKSGGKAAIKQRIRDTAINKRNKRNIGASGGDAPF